ncbi:tyrosine protein kinase [Paenibacillus sp. LHD-38]|uniref:tyrosine protein kinase n=1 Tax=Paenibacillus sp. LHD-38 TaxID=3072143 RepID=UPI00280F2A4A|nr:tyrosine protein kinase [Paenibacillus sp. LHD-38]MDQ8733915.1 tyrosine protein kinase [Paenibacillus sp. LHD-38]
MNYRNNPGNGNQQYDWHGGQRLTQGPPSKSSGAKSSGFNFGGDLPTMPPASPSPQTQDILPAVIPESTAELIETTASSKAGGFSLASLGEIKGYIDRIGGIDGILTTVTKVQKVMSSVSQMAPLVKVLMGSFSKKSSSDSDDDDGEWKPKRRKRRKPSSGSSNNGVRRRKPKRRR